MLTNMMLSHDSGIKSIIYTYIVFHWTCLKVRDWRYARVCHLWLDHILWSWIQHCNMFCCSQRQREIISIYILFYFFIVYGTSIPFTSGNKTNQHLICILRTTANTKIFILTNNNMKHENWLGWSEEHRWNRIDGWMSWHIIEVFLGGGKVN